MSLAAEADVATVLGLADVSSLPADQALRLPGELARVERSFLREALRDFTPGPTKVQCTVVGGWVTLLDLPANDEDTPITVEDRNGHALDVLVSDGSALKVGRHQRSLPSGSLVNVTYVAPDVPDAVRVAVAAITARRLSVVPGSPESKFTDLTAGADFRAKGAAWVSSTSVLTEDEKCEARSYRPVAGTVIIARWDGERRRWFENEGWGWDYPVLYGGGW